MNISFVETQTDTLTEVGSRTNIRIRSATNEEYFVSTIGLVFVPYKPAASHSLSTSAYVCECLVEPITKQDTESGIIYMYWVKGNFGLVKIGKTSGPSTRQRLLKWQEDCGHELQEHTRGEEEMAIQLPHVYRLVKLLHAELNNVRLKEQACVRYSLRGGKPKSRIEWFE